MSSTRLFDAASNSTISGICESSVVGSIPFISRANILAADVFPVPRGPENK